MQALLDNWGLTTLGCVAATVVYWLWEQHAASDALTAPPSRTRGLCNPVPLERFAAASTTAAEVAKLRATPAFQMWFSLNAARLEEQEHALRRRALWVDLSLIAIAVYASLALPFTSADADAPSLNAHLAALPLPQLAPAVVALAAMLIGLVGAAPALRTVLIVSFAVLLLVADCAKAGFGFCVLFTTVAAKALWL